MNSAAGLLGQIKMGVTLASDVLFMVGLALMGGFIGAYLGSRVLNNAALKQVLAFVLVLASIKLLLF